MAVRGIIYNEGGNPLNYEAVTISTTDNGDHKWDSGDFVRDWYFSTKFILMGGLKGEVGCNSSSVDHFIMDDAPFESVYLIFDEGNNPTLTNQYDLDGHNIELFVPTGTQLTWEELRDVCGDQIMKVDDTVSFVRNGITLSGIVLEFIDLPDNERDVIVSCGDDVVKVPYMDFIRPER